MPRLLIQIDKPAILDGVPAGTANVEIEADSPAKVMFQMQRHGCSTDYIKNVLAHLEPVFGESHPHWYAEPDQKQISKDLQRTHPAYGYVGN